MVVQNVKGDEIEEGMKILRSLYKVAKEDKRTDCPLNELRIGLKCGGSDGFSGITANPLVGELSDYIVAQVVRQFLLRCQKCLVQKLY